MAVSESTIRVVVLRETVIVDIAVDLGRHLIEGVASFDEAAEFVGNVIDFEVRERCCGGGGVSGTTPKSATLFVNQR